LGFTSCGLGECVHTVDNCVGGVTQVCDPMEGAAAEVCDGIDNDCDDDVDEDLGTTTCGVGPCAHTVDNCVGGVAQECDPFAGATPEICDGIDNDCNPHSLDGADEEPPANTRDAGVCAGSLQSCQDGRWQDDYSGVPGYEVPEASCDGLDNDCNGLADDPFGPDSCSFTCTAGGDVWTGHDGLLACCGNDEGEANPYQAVEAVCNDLSDNDCNGQVDCQDAACATDPHCVDADGDGHFADMDCADDDPAVHPGATEFCTIDGLFVERDCDPDTVLNCLDFCGDLDDDGFVTEETWESWGGELQSVVCPWVTGWGDCNDGNALVHPGAEEECDGQDNDCDGLVDEGCNTLHCPQLPQAVNYVDNGIPLACPGLDPGPSRLLLVDSSCHPLANVRVNLRTAANGYITYRRTNREGVADFSGYHGRAIPDHFEVGFRGATFSTAAGSFAGGAGVQTWDYTLTLLDSDCNPIPNVRVNLRRSNDSFVTHARTNGAGIASFEVLPGARLKLEVEYRGGRWRSEANTAQIDVVLSTERFELLLLDSHGAPLDNVRVNLRPANGCYVTSARTGVAGVAGFQVLPGVPLLFEVSYHGATYRTLPSVTHLREVVRTLPFGVVLTSSEGLPIEGVRVDLRRGASNGHVTRTRTGPDGVASFEVLPGALQRLQLTYHGATWRSGPITVDQPTLLPLQTYSFGMLLLTSDEQPIENARVVLERADGSQVTSARTGVDGVAAFEVLPGATMRLEGYYHGSRYQTAATTLVEDTLLTVHTMRFGVVLTDSQGEPIENARVNLRRANGRYVTSLRTDALGVAAFQVFPGACMLLEVVYNGSQFRTARTCLVEDTMIAIQLPVLVPVSTNRLGLLLLDSLDQPLR
ncbi:MAG: hypothetical protein FJ125_09190, partial [Deltaproteobacteria bacterium]|nr:hypothetical protein [Deltaproteobacteria bacterium]